MSGTGFENLSVLIVDDNPHMRATLRALMETAGVQAICEAVDGSLALKALKERNIDLVLTDMAMKPMDGITFTRKIRKDRDSPNPFLPVIMITGHTERARVLEARDAGVTEFLAKPVTTQNLYARIAEIMERPRAFVRCGDFFGPDRRRHARDSYDGPRRRQDDLHDIELR